MLSTILGIEDTSVNKAESLAHTWLPTSYSGKGGMELLRRVPHLGQCVEVVREGVGASSL